MGAVVYFKIFNPMNSVINVQNANQATRLLASTTLRNMLGTKNLHDILADREEIAKTMLAQLDHATDSWGIRVERVEVKDVRLPLRDDEAGPGVREGRHIPTGKGEERRSCGTWTVLHHSLPGHHPDRRPQDHHL